MLKSLLSRPFIALLLMLLLGYSIFESFAIPICCVTLVISSSIFFFYKYRYGAKIYWLFSIPVIIFLFYLRNQIHLQEDHNTTIAKIIILKNHLAEIIHSELKKDGTQISLKFNYNHSDYGAIVKCKQFLNPTSTLPGSQIYLTANLERIEICEELEAFNYEKYLDHNHIHFRGRIDSSGLTIPANPAQNFYTLSSKSNIILQSILEKYIQDSELSSLLIGILLGDKSGISERLKQQFIQSGTAHILAVSGMHIGMLYSIILGIFKILNFRGSNQKILRTTIAISLVWVFSFLTGLGASILRAAVMFTFIEIGQGLGKKPDSVNIVCCAAFFMLFFNPCLLFDIGLQLSFFAVLSIILFYPILHRNLISKYRVLNYILDTLCVCLSVQFLITPVTLFHFHCFPTYFVLSNLIWVPLSFILMLAGIAIVMLNYIMPWIAELIGTLTELFLKFGIYTFECLEKLPYAQLSEVPFHISELILSLICIASLYSWIQLHSKKLIYASILSSVLFCIQPLVQSWMDRNSIKLIIYKFSNEPLADVKIGNSLLSIIPYELAPFKKTFFQNQHPLIKHSRLTLPSDNKIILELSSSNLRNTRFTICVDSVPNSPVYCQFLILKNAKIKLESICNVDDGKIIVSPQASYAIKQYYQRIQPSLPKMLIPEYHSFSLKL